jgi:hypothetical protein
MTLRPVASGLSIPLEAMSDLTSVSGLGVPNSKSICIVGWNMPMPAGVLIAHVKNHAVVVFVLVSRLGSHQLLTEKTVSVYFY